ncbi:GATA zinc finger domain-containing protein 24 [Melia azedarach]|uniref:GATA zinc finger domain-containing protein 24 n=1 Tax=Melia azedarach TaxID=155640 RepID=A0ACC1X7E2_MELAZ|nr:GATA zinc finger domain-containing protein 24 [Melia azedarach]
MPLTRSLEANINTAGDENKEDENTVLSKSCTGRRRNFFDGDENKEDGNTVLSKSCPARQRKVFGISYSQMKDKHEPQHALPQDFIEKQRAYFAEIDAFELAEEEVESADQLE